MVRREFIGRLAGGVGALAAGGSLIGGADLGQHDPTGSGGAPPAGVSPKAWDIHRRAVIVDGHNDSLIEHWARKQSYDLTRDWPDYHADLARMRAGGLAAMFSMVGDADLVQGLELWSAMYENLDGHPEAFLLVDGPDDVLRAKREGRVGLIGQLEGGGMLHKSLRVLHTLVKLGVRVAGLTHGEGGGEDHLQKAKSPFGPTTAAEREAARKSPDGLTDFGREAVKELVRLGVVIDLAHANDAAFFEVLEMTSVPVVFSHGNVFALMPHWRNLTVDMLRALAQNGGVIGLATYPEFVDPDPAKRTLDRFADHVEAVCDAVGDGHVGFGADYDGMKATGVVPSYADLPRVTQVLLDRGFKEESIHKFWGGNFLRVMRAAKAAARRGGPPVSASGSCT